MKASLTLNNNNGRRKKWKVWWREECKRIKLVWMKYERESKLFFSFLFLGLRLSLSLEIYFSLFFWIQQLNGDRHKNPFLSSPFFSFFDFLLFFSSQNIQGLSLFLPLLFLICSFFFFFPFSIFFNAFFKKI